MQTIPSGTLTFLFTDIEGSTRLWETEPDLMGAALSHHDDIVRRAIESHAGYVFHTAGDAFGAAFASADAAASAAVDAQRELTTLDWGGPELRTRMSLHTGESYERDGDYFGPTLAQNRSREHADAAEFATVARHLRTDQVAVLQARGRDMTPREMASFVVAELDGMLVPADR